MRRHLAGAGETLFAFRDVRRCPGADSVELWIPGEAAARTTLSGKGARILSEVLAILDPAREVPVVGAHADGLSPVGLPIRGIALGGARGILLIPVGLVGLVPNASLTLPLETLDAALWSDGALRLEVSGELDPRVRLQGDHLTPTSFGDWWAAAAGPTGVDSDAPLEVLWADDARVLSPAKLDLVDGGVVVRSTRGPDRGLRSAGLWLEASGSTDVAGGAVRVRLHVRGAAHTMWLRDGSPAARALRRHLAATRLSAWPEDFESGTWRRATGSWSAARVMVPGTDELVLRRPLVVSVSTGLVLCCAHVDGTRLRPLPRGHRVKVELLDDRSGLRFTAIVLDQSPRCVSCGGCEAETAGQVLALFPTGVPERRTSRRARHRVEVPDTVPVQLRSDDPERGWCGHLHNLSAEGAGVVLEGDGPPVGAVVELRLPVGLAGVASVRAELLHTTADGPTTVRLGLRFVHPTERVRALFQREVLRVERRTLALASSEAGRDSEVLPPPEPGSAVEAEGAGPGRADQD